MVKYRGQVRITKEMTKVLLGLPHDVQFDGTEYDAEREIYSFFFSTAEEKLGWTRPTTEGMSSYSVELVARAEELIERTAMVLNSLPKEERNALLNKFFTKDEG